VTSGFKLLVRLVDHVVAMQFDADQARQHILGTHRRRRRQERLRDELSVAASWAVAFDRLALDDPLAFRLGIRLPGRTHPPGQRHIRHVLSG